MIDFLAVLCQTTIVAVTVTAFIHFFGVFMQVHFEAKRFGLRGRTEDEMLRLRRLLRERWPTLIPLALLIFVLVSGRTPYLAALCGISPCAIVGLSTQVAGSRPANGALLVGLHAVLAGLVFGGLQHEGVKPAVFAGSVLAAALAIRLGLAKALVAFVFVSSPALLLVARSSSWCDFSVTFLGCILGISPLAAALSKVQLVEMRRWEQLLCGLGAVLMVLPDRVNMLIGAALAAPVLLHQWAG